MRKWVLNIHLYLGLLCSSYLIIFGVSSLSFNHRFAFTDPATDTTNWERALTLRPGDGTKFNADMVRNDLGLMGWTMPPPGETTTDADGGLKFNLWRPGKAYQITVASGSSVAKVAETRQGYWTVIRSLHGFRRLANARFVSLWGYYTELCTAAVLFASISGIYLFTIRKSERRLNWIILSAATAASVAFILFIRFWA